MNLNLKSLRRQWMRVKNATVHQTNSLDANVMIELLDRLESETQKRIEAEESEALACSLATKYAGQLIKEQGVGFL